jgi:hypothetical protein
MGVQPRLRCSLLGRWTTNTVQEPFSRLLPQHILVRPPSLSELCVSEAVQVEKTAHRPRRMTVPEHVAGSLQDREVRQRLNSATGSGTSICLPPVSGPDKVRPSHRGCSKSPEDRSQPDQHPLPFDVVLGTCDIFGSSRPPVPGASLLIEKRLSIRLVSAGKIFQEA